MFKKFKITCDQATTICDKAQYNEASLYERIQLNYHLFACKICARYSKQNHKMSAIFKMSANNCKNEVRCLSKHDKDTLKEKLRELH